jgi:hypothetical protein
MSEHIYKRITNEQEYHDLVQSVFKDAQSNPFVQFEVNNPQLFESIQKAEIEYIEKIKEHKVRFSKKNRG